MDKYEGKRYFKECCNLCDIEAEKIFVIGARSSNLKKNRLEYNNSCVNRSDSLLFAACYFYEEDIYVVWSLHIPKNLKRSTFSVKRDEVIDIDEKRIKITNKAVEYSSWNYEDVYSFKPDTLMKFLTEYVKRQIV